MRPMGGRYGSFRKERSGFHVDRPPSKDGRWPVLSDTFVAHPLAVATANAAAAAAATAARRMRCGLKWCAQALKR